MYMFSYILWYVLHCWVICTSLHIKVDLFRWGESTSKILTSWQVGQETSIIHDHCTSPFIASRFFNGKTQVFGGTIHACAEKSHWSEALWLLEPQGMEGTGARCCTNSSLNTFMEPWVWCNLSMSIDMMSSDLRKPMSKTICHDHQQIAITIFGGELLNKTSRWT